MEFMFYFRWIWNTHRCKNYYIAKEKTIHVWQYINNDVDLISWWKFLVFVCLSFFQHSRPSIVCACLCVYMFMCDILCVYMFMCVHVYVCICLCVYAYVYMFVCICLFMYMFMCVNVNVWYVYLYICLFVYMFLCDMIMYICLCVYTLMFMCVYVYVWYDNVCIFLCVIFVRVYIQYTYIVGKYKIYLYEL